MTTVIVPGRRAGAWRRWWLTAAVLLSVAVVLLAVLAVLALASGLSHLNLADLHLMINGQDRSIDLQRALGSGSGLTLAGVLLAGLGLLIGLWLLVAVPLALLAGLGGLVLMALLLALGLVGLPLLAVMLVMLLVASPLLLGVWLLRRLMR